MTAAVASTLIPEAAWRLRASGILAVIISILRRALRTIAFKYIFKKYGEYKQHNYCYYWMIFYPLNHDYSIYVER